MQTSGTPAVRLVLPLLTPLMAAGLGFAVHVVEGLADAGTTARPKARHVVVAMRVFLRNGLFTKLTLRVRD
ncbi:hypothetical protein ACI2LX_09860 [Streptomyces fungicidicus]|uniref:hypothetical protein n=1 Tax=Streptomyces fungicidicus TaxID=68203 RepID=UPI00384D0C84